MIFSDGECPVCQTHSLHLNTADLLECPECRLVCSARDPVVATVMPFLGQSNFRLQDCVMTELRGIAFAKSLDGSDEPDLQQIFESQAEMTGYLSQLSDQQNAKDDGETLCDRFLQAFAQHIAETDVEELARAWKSLPARTAFYTRKLMPAIASSLRLVHGKELYRVDFAMSKESANGRLIPKIYIESENNFASAGHEILKLCSMTTPLRVLVTLTDKKFVTEPGAGAYKQLREWQQVIKDHSSELQGFFRGVVCIVIARRMESGCEFVACAFRENADLYRPLAPLWPQRLS